MQLTEAKTNQPPKTQPKILANLRTHWPTLVVAGLTILAFLLRRKGLATQSLWFDEADLVARAGRDLSTLLGDFLRPGENGPLYTLFMHFWLQIAGASEAAVRTPALLAGTALVPLVYLLGRQFLGGPLVGLISAALVAISPYQIWYSQDAKMYPLALTLTVAAFWLFLTALERKKAGRWVAYALLTTVGFYVHVMTALVVLVQLAYYFFGFRRLQPKSGAASSPTRKRLWWLAGAMVLLYSPIALWQLRALWDGGIGKTWFAPVSLPEMLNALGRKFSVNRMPDLLWETLGALFYAGLLAVGLWAVWRWSKTRQAGQAEFTAPPTQHPAILLTLYLLFPILGFYLLTMRIPLFADRYLLIASPAYYLLVAWGLGWLGKKFWPVGLVCGLIAAAFALTALYSFNYSEAPQKEDWREAMRQLKSEIRPGDEVIVLPGYAKTAVDYYFKSGEVPVYTVPQELLNGEKIRELNDYLFGAQGIIRDRERAWLVVSPDRYHQDDPTEFLLKIWFNYNTWMFTDPKEYVGVKIYGFEFKQFPGTDKDYYSRTNARQVDLQVGNSLKLEGYEAIPAADSKTPLGQVRYDEKLHLSFYWRKVAEDKTDYEISVRLLDANGNDTGTNYAAQPLGGYYPTSKWKLQEATRDYRELYIHVPPGKYQLELSIYPVGQPQNKLKINGTHLGQTATNVTNLGLPLNIEVLPK